MGIQQQEYNIERRLISNEISEDMASTMTELRLEQVKK